MNESAKKLYVRLMNEKFLDEEGKERRVEYPELIIQTLDNRLERVNPYDKKIKNSKAVQKAIIEECRKNPFYFFREVCKTTDGKEFIFSESTVKSFLLLDSGYDLVHIVSEKVLNKEYTYMMLLYLALFKEKFECRLHTRVEKKKIINIMKHCVPKWMLDNISLDLRFKDSTEFVEEDTVAASFHDIPAPISGMAIPYKDKNILEFYDMESLGDPVYSNNHLVHESIKHLQRFYIGPATDTFDTKRMTYQVSMSQSLPKMSMLNIHEVSTLRKGLPYLVKTRYEDVGISDIEANKYYKELGSKEFGKLMLASFEKPFQR